MKLYVCNQRPSMIVNYSHFKFEFLHRVTCVNFGMHLLSLEVRWMKLRPDTGLVLFFSRRSRESLSRSGAKLGVKQEVWSRQLSFPMARM